MHLRNPAAGGQGSLSGSPQTDTAGWKRARQKAARDFIHSLSRAARLPQITGKAVAICPQTGQACLAHCAPKHPVLLLRRFSLESWGWDSSQYSWHCRTGRSRCKKWLKTQKAASFEKEKCCCNICLTLVCSFISTKWSINQTGVALPFFYGLTINLVPVLMKNEGEKNML